MTPSRFFTVTSLSLCLAWTLTLQATGQAAEPVHSEITGQSGRQAQSPIKEKTEGLTRTDGFFTTYHDAAKDKVWLEVDPGMGEFIYVNSLAAGVGSNDIGLDRGQLGDTRVVRFERRGPTLMLVQPNQDYRAETENPLERRSVAEAFASSILWGFEIAAEEDGRLLVDLTPFLLRDAHGVIETLRRTQQGTYSLDKSRSALYPEAILNFPDNSEFEAILTFQGSQPGAWIRSVVPTPEAVTVRQHHSFVRLPDDGYRKRAYDPRAGFFGITYQDYGTPVDEPLVKRYIARHRLEKKDSSLQWSEPVEPIVYYLDNGTPEPIRSALLEGARWWNQAFEAAGYRDAFRVEILPEDAHPLDVRYNVIQWVHRSTRGWSYGASVTDPRTGEIIKGHVSLGSLRVRQDYLIATGLLGQQDPAALEMALARIRQLSAHEVGHTLGIMHNFAASTVRDASVMDYPHPQVRRDGDRLLLDRAYDSGIGEWDMLAVAYGYQDVPDGMDEADELDRILEKGYADGMRFIADQDARPLGGAHPNAHLWDYGSDPATQLDEIMAIRRIALDRFGENVLRPGQPLAELEDALVPIYFFHRYQVEATVKLVAGVDYAYGVKGDAQASPSIVPAAAQQQALNALMETLEPAQLAMPDFLLDLIPPRPAGMAPSRELFRGGAGPVLDALGIAGTAADLTLAALLAPERINRLVEQSARGHALGFDELLDRLLDASWNRRPSADYLGSIQRVVNHAVLRRIMGAAASKELNPLAVSTLHALLEDLQTRFGNASDPDSRYAAHLIDRFMHDPGAFDLPDALPPPPGAPIGVEGGWDAADRWGEYCSHPF